MPEEVNVLINELTELGELIRRRRTERHLSQTELAEQIGATRQWVSRLEKGKNDIGTARLFAVLNALELNLDIRPPRAGDSSKALDAGAPSLIPPETLRALARLNDHLRREAGNPPPSAYRAGTDARR